MNVAKDNLDPELAEIAKLVNTLRIDEADALLKEIEAKPVEDLFWPRHFLSIGALRDRINAAKAKP